jgi:hypothetical protein
MAHDPADVDKAFGELAPKDQGNAAPSAAEAPVLPDVASETSSTSTGL